MSSIDKLERMRAIVAQAAAEVESRGNGRLIRIYLDIYGEFGETEVRQLFQEASAGTRVEAAELVITYAGSRYICWNCCGLRFDSKDGICPNCYEEALAVPEEIAFALRRTET